MARYYFEKWELAYDWDSITYGESDEGFNITSGRKFDLATANLEETNTPYNNIPFSHPFLITGNDIPDYNAGKAVRLSIKGTRAGSRRLSNQSYSKTTLPREKTALIETIVAEENAYPIDGIQGDFWYVRGAKAFPDVKIKQGSSLVTVQTAFVKHQGQLKEVQEIYTKKDGVLEQAR